jgi:hypothetical protein
LTALPLAGPSSPLRSKKAETRRVINWIPVQIDSGTGKGGAVAYLKQAPGLRLLATLGGAVQGLFMTAGRFFAVANQRLLEVKPDWSTIDRGAVGYGRIKLTANNTQLLATNGPSAWIFDLESDTLASLTDNWRGSVSADVLDGYGVLAEPNSTQFYLTSNQDFSALDPLDFASAEGSTGPIVSFIVKHRELILLKEATGEVWYDAGGSDFPLARQDGAALEVGCAAAASLCKVGGTAYWLGRDDRGSAVVFTMSAYQPQRISSHALEEALAGLADLSEASAFTYHQEGLTYYCLRVPGLSSTWVYEVSGGIWHERAELVNGVFVPWRAEFHCFAHGLHVIGDASGKLYELTHEANTNAGDVLARDFITPHNALPSLALRRFSAFQIDADVGQGKPDGTAATMLLRYSDDGGKTWANWRELSLGAVGQTLARARTTMLGSGRDRVWHFRVTDDVMCNVLAAVVDEK